MQCHTLPAAVGLLFGGFVMSAVSSQLPPSQLAELEEFVFRPDQFAKENIPRGLDPAEAARFLIAHLDHTAPLGPLRQAEKVIDFYDLNEVAAHLRGFLNKTEKDSADRQRSVTIARSVARSGAPADRAFAGVYFHYLLEKASANELAELASVLEALGPEAGVQPLRDTGKRRLDTASSADARTLRTLLSHTIPRLEQANSAKARVLAMQDRPRRIHAEINLYLGITPDYPEYLPAWSARRLRREAWADEPAQQTVRAANPQRAHEVAGLFRQAIAEVARDKDETEDIRASMRLTCLRAVDFFGGALAQPEHQELHQTKGGQYDVLSNY